MTVGPHALPELEEVEGFLTDFARRGMRREDLVFVADRIMPSYGNVDAARAVIVKELEAFAAELDAVTITHQGATARAIVQVKRQGVLDAIDAIKEVGR